MSETLDGISVIAGSQVDYDEMVRSEGKSIAERALRERKGEEVSAAERLLESRERYAADVARLAEEARSNPDRSDRIMEVITAMTIGAVGMEDYFRNVHGVIADDEGTVRLVDPYIDMDPARLGTRLTPQAYEYPPMFAERGRIFVPSAALGQSLADTWPRY